MNPLTFALCLTGLCLAYMWIKILAHRMARDLFEAERETFRAEHCKCRESQDQ